MRKPFKKNRHVIIDDGFDEFYPNQLLQSSDKTPGIERLEGEICKPLKPSSVGGYFTPCCFFGSLSFILKADFSACLFQAKRNLTQVSIGSKSSSSRNTLPLMDFHQSMLL